jgi:hypothetical protein
MEKEFVDALDELAAHMNKIERRLKQAEQLREEVVIPGINELRYAGRRFVDAWSACAGQPTAKKKQEARDHIIVARQYLQNADHDVTDAICFFIHGEINRMQRRYGVNELIRVFPQYAQFAREMQTANRIISGSRETREERALEYARLEADYINPLVNTYETLRFSEALALASAKRRRLGTATIATLGAGGAIYGLWEPASSLIAIIGALF